MNETARRRQEVGSGRAPLLRLPFFDSDAAVVAAIRAGQSAGGAALYDRHQRYVRRVLTRVLGPGADLEDLIQDVFEAAIDSMTRLEDPDALRSWLAAISVHHARREIHRRARSRLFTFFASSELPEQEAPVATPEIDEAVRTTYRILEKLAVSERVPFALRYLGGMELVEVADACHISLATVKRRLTRARKKFLTMARSYPELSEWVAGGAT